MSDILYDSCQPAAQDHRNHTFEKLSVAYGRHKKKIRMEAAGLRRRRKVQIVTMLAWTKLGIE